MTLDTASAYAPSADVGSYHHALAFTGAGAYDAASTADIDDSTVSAFPVFYDPVGWMTPASTGDVFTFAATC